MRQEFVVIDYTQEMAILATVEENGKEVAVGMGQAIRASDIHTAEVAFSVRDSYHGQGIGTELLTYLTQQAQMDGLLGFTADVLVENTPMLHVFEKMGFDMERKIQTGAYELKMRFTKITEKGMH
jgi:RimJ/RimL family protein N-acetyltransferase